MCMYCWIKGQRTAKNKILADKLHATSKKET